LNNKIQILLIIEG